VGGVSPQRIAALDVGSNTVHLLVADVLSPRRLRQVQREAVMARLGAVVGATGAIGPAKLAEVCALVQRLAALAVESGAAVLLFCATEAVRRAADRELAVRALGEAAGVPCVLISGEVEARLAFRGAVSMAGGEGLALVCDIGGGSTELALGRPDHIDALVSLPIGSGAATDRWLPSDPPTPDELAVCASGVREVLGAAPPGSPDAVITTGGTASTLPRLLGRDPDSSLTADDLAQCRSILTAHPSAAVAATHSLDPARARVLAGGVEIIDAIRTRYSAPAVRTTIHGLRTGMILAHAANGDAWVEG
jgi:exopolyphosphatase / guanosine-5'-triphosphate,3'-diphosphate pyrophosphatase